jgi:UDP-N-acetylglucosamine transferase subunit ALG13
MGGITEKLPESDFQRRDILIFITVGSQKFQFNRLLKYIDDLVETKVIKEEVFAQTGVSDYLPKNYSCQKFLSRDEFHHKIQDSELIITHGGTGVIMGAIKAGKRVIAVPRLQQYKEHVDDHQEQIIAELMAAHLIIGVKKLEDIADLLAEIESFPVPAYHSNTDTIIKDIDDYLLLISEGK